MPLALLRYASDHIPKLHHPPLLRQGAQFGRLETFGKVRGIPCVHTARLRHGHSPLPPLCTHSGPFEPFPSPFMRLLPLCCAFLAAFARPPLCPINVRNVSKSVKCLLPSQGIGLPFRFFQKVPESRNRARISPPFCWLKELHAHPPGSFP